MALLLPAGNPSAWTGPEGNNTWLLNGRVPTLIDAGVGRPEHIDSVARALGGRPLSQVLVTHGHVDHASGVPALESRWPDVSVRQYGTRNTLRHDERIEGGDTVLRVLHTPGHSPDHCSFLDETTRDLFCGDLVQRGGTVVIPATRGGNLVHYLESLKLVSRLEPTRLLPGHGAVIEDPQAVIAYYLEHRAQRDEQILKALRTKPSTTTDIVRVVYQKLPAAFENAAADTVLAHLIKLRDEGRVREEAGGIWAVI